jgi:hypothetical protein
MSGNTWIEFVRIFRDKNPQLSYKDALVAAKKPYQDLKKKMNKQRGGNFNNIDLVDPKMRFEAGVSPLNSNLNDIGRRVIF